MILSQNFDEYRALMKTGENSEKSAKTLIEKSTLAYKQTNRPIYAGFLAVGQFFMAKHVFNPFKKMSYFNEGKLNLENAVKSDPKNVEIRLMRLITQEKAPKFLGYSDNISADRNFLIKEYLHSTDADLKMYIKNYLKL
jgi:hypothetical protein